MKGLMQEDIKEGGAMYQKRNITAADGGRIGLKNGVTKDGILFPMKKDGFLISPDFDNMTEEQKMLMEG